MNLRKRIWKKSYFEPKLLERIIFYHFFTTKQTLNQKFWNVSVFERNFNNSNSSNLESKLVEHVRFRTKTSYYPSEFESNILQCLRFWRKVFCGKLKFIAKIALKNNFSGSSHTVKTIQLALSCCIEKLDSDFFCEKKKNIFINQIFRAASHFETRFSKRVWFWAKIFEHVIFWTNFFKIWLIFNWNTKNVSDNQVQLEIFKVFCSVSGFEYSF